MPRQAADSIHAFGVILQGSRLAFSFALEGPLFAELLLINRN
jgi:hypothetical protein